MTLQTKSWCEAEEDNRFDVITMLLLRLRCEEMILLDLVPNPRGTTVESYRLFCKKKRRH
jgi:hypothetical protein